MCENLEEIAFHAAKKPARSAVCAECTFPPLPVSEPFGAHFYNVAVDMWPDMAVVGTFVHSIAPSFLIALAFVFMVKKIVRRSQFGSEQFRHYFDSGRSCGDKRSFQLGRISLLLSFFNLTEVLGFNWYMIKDFAPFLHLSKVERCEGLEIWPALRIKEANI